jgi:hypothetical protein
MLVKKFHMLLAASGLLALAACGGSGDDKAAEAVENQAEEQAQALESQADALEAAGNEAGADAVENQADIVEEAGEQKADAIDDADPVVTDAAPTTDAAPAETH